jgi:hypothetical protein
MRTSRRFAPAFDCMSARIAPSTISLINPTAHMVVPAASAMDSTGEPGNNPSNGGNNLIILDNGNGGNNGGLC